MLTTRFTADLRDNGLEECEVVSVDEEALEATVLVLATLDRFTVSLDELFEAVA